MGGGLQHRICRVYAALGVVVPVFGLATATGLGVLGDAWLSTSIVVTVAAAGLLGVRILPGQTAVLASSGNPGGPGDPGAPPGGSGALADRSVTARRLGMLTGVFNLLWAAVVVLMIVRPSSSTGPDVRFLPITAAVEPGLLLVLLVHRQPSTWRRWRRCAGRCTGARTCT